MKHWIIIFILLVITSLFFYKTVTKGYVPFPGDLLISEYQPWKSYSYEGHAPGGYPNKAQYFDVIRQIYPWKEFSVSQLKQGHLPLWNPHNFSGSPLLANLQSTVFYPLTLLYLLLPMVTAWTLSVMLQPFLAACFTYLYAKKIGISTASSLFAGISFGFSLYMIVFLEYNTIGHVMLWLPFLLYAVEAYYDSAKKRYIALLALGIAISLFAGHLQLFTGIYLFGILYTVIRHPNLSDKKTRTLLMTWLIGLGVSAIQLIPTLELITHSARVNHDPQDLANRLLLQPKQLLMMISPDIFGNPATRNYLLQDSYPGKAMYAGLIPFFFTVVLLFKKKTTLQTFFFVASALLLLLVVRSPISIIFYSLPIPLLNSSAPGNYLFFLSFFIAILGSFGLDNFLKDRLLPKRIYLIFFTILCILAFLVTQQQAMKSMMIFSSIFIMCTCILSFLYSKRILTTKIFTILLILLLVGDLFYFFRKFNPFVPASLVFPKASIMESTILHEPTRSWGYGAAELQSNFSTMLGIYSPDGYDPLYPKWYGEFIAASKTGNVETTFTRETRSDARIAQGFGKEAFLESIPRNNILSILGVSYIFDIKENGLDEQTFNPSHYSPVLNDTQWTVYKNNAAFPRVFFMDQLSDYTDANELPLVSSGSAILSSYTPQSIAIDIESPKEQYAILSDTYYPGWKATVNGNPVPVEKTLHTLRAIKIPQGHSTIQMTYEPDSLKFGVILSAISVLSLCILIRKKHI
jgi:hypothetical protein